MSKTFIDTNILAYGADRHEPRKRSMSRDLLKSLQVEGGGVISTQILQEFYVTATRKLGMDPLLVKGMMNHLKSLELVIVDFELIKEAVDCSVLNQLSFWDALVVVSAEKARCEIILTEDLNHGQIIRGVEIRNPFDRE